MMHKVLLKLYVTGQSPRSEQAIANLRRICEAELQGRYEMSIVDVLKEPEVADQEMIVATPTLIRSSPPPVRRIIGDLSDTAQVLLGLGLNLYDAGMGEEEKEEKGGVA